MASPRFVIPALAALVLGSGCGGANGGSASEASATTGADSGTASKPSVSADGPGPPADAGAAAPSGPPEIEPEAAGDSGSPPEPHADAGAIGGDDAGTGGDAGAAELPADGGTPPEPDYPFVPYPGSATDPDPAATRLCQGWDTPDDLADKVNIGCELEGGSFAPPNPEAPATLRIVAYNIERGYELDRQIELFSSHPDVPRPDVMLIGEADRGCSRTGHRNVLRDFARALGMNYVYAVEFVELPRASGSGGAIAETCEHGNGILSRFPIGNARAIRHAQNRSWYLTPEERANGGEPRLGGRVAANADILVGTRIVHLYAIHFESSGDAFDIQTAQAIEIAEDGLTKPYQVIVGGDTNAPTYWIDIQQGTHTDATANAFLKRKYVDAHDGLPYSERGTRGGLVLDLIFGKDAVFTGSKVCPAEICEGLSDHLPVWTTLELPTP